MVVIVSTPHSASTRAVSGASTVQTDGSLEEEYEKLKEGGTIVISMAWEDVAADDEEKKQDVAEKEKADGGGKHAPP